MDHTTLSLHYLKSMWSLGVNTAEMFDVFIENLKQSSQQLTTEMLYEILELENIPPDIEDKVIRLLIELACFDYQKILVLMGVLTKYENREFRVCLSLAKCVKLLNLPTDFIHENDHLSGLMEQNDLRRVNKFFCLKDPKNNF